MASVLDHAVEVNPAFTRPTANLSGAALFVEGGHTFLSLVTGKGRAIKEKFYRVEALPSDFGNAYRLTPVLYSKLTDGEHYDVLQDGPASSCSCPGHVFTGGCSHLSALLHFDAEGRLP